MARWIGLPDPTAEELGRAIPVELHPRARDQLLARASQESEPRPTLESHGAYVFGVFLVPVAVPDRDEVYAQEVDVVLMHDTAVTVRKRPPAGEPFACEAVRAVRERRPESSAGMVAYHLVDDVAEAYLDLIDALNDEIDELEAHVETWTATEVRARVSSLRHDFVHVRRTLGPTRDAVRRVIDGRVDTDERELFDREVELHFADAYDKLLRASEGLELSRDLLAAVREYHQSKIANDQSEVMKRFAVIASLLLVPTFIVGLYGQNFDVMPELEWRLGYLWSWAWIVLATVGQLFFYRWKRWI